MLISYSIHININILRLVQLLVNMRDCEPPGYSNNRAHDDFFLVNILFPYAV